MARDWPEGPDDPVDPALGPLIEADDAESEGFELAEEDLVDEAELDADPMWQDAEGFDELEDDDFDYSDYAEAYDEGGGDDPNW